MQERTLKEKVVDNDGAEPMCGVGRLRLSCFRNYLSLDVEFAPGFNIVAGENAQGKTNLLEALYLLATARLLRGSRDREAIYFGESLARAQGELIAQPTEVEVRIEEGVKKSAYLNGIRLPRASDLLGRLPCVSVGSIDLCLAQGEPADRRLFLDLELSQSRTSYLRDLALYKKSLEHRNALLRRGRESLVDSRDFEPWEVQMATSGAELRRARAEFIEELGPLARGVHRHLGAGEELGIAYAQKDVHTAAEELLAAYGRYRSEDILRGATSFGPHRDDVSVEIGGAEARLFGSQGQQRTAVIALKLATLQLGQASGRTPLLLLDDMLSDLDEGRRARLVEWSLHHARQAVLTCTEPRAAGQELLDRAQILTVSQGTVTVT